VSRHMPADIVASGAFIQSTAARLRGGKDPRYAGFCSWLAEMTSRACIQLPAPVKYACQTALVARLCTCPMRA
jgi:hypothetical protein